MSLLCLMYSATGLYSRFLFTSSKHFEARYSELMHLDHFNVTYDHVTLPVSYCFVIMAEEALKKLEEQLNCSICLDTYIDPKLLQCFHVYCRQCLVPLVDRDQQGELGLSCPTCRQVTPIPDRGVAGLQSAFLINDLLGIKKSLQKVDNPATTPEGAAKEPELIVKPSVLFCFEHHEEELRLYCETCGELVCVQCVMKGGKHHDHDCAVLKKAFDSYNAEIMSSLEPVEKQVTIIQKALVQLDACCREISDQRAVTEDNIHVTFRRLREILNVRETELIGRLHELTLEKLKGLAAQRDQIETTLAQLHSCLHFMRESLRPGNEGDVLMMKANTVRQIKELTIPFQPDFLEPNTKADIVLSAPADMTAVCQIYGQVFPAGSPDPSKCHIAGKGAEVAVVGEKSTAILQAINLESKPCEEPIKSLECKLVSEITGTRASCSVERRGQSQYEISYQPTIKGRQQLHIKVQGQHIRGSPLSLAAKSPVEKLGGPILTISGVGGPCGVAFNRRGEMVVTEWNRNCVSVFRPSGEKVQSFGKHGSGQGEFNRPSGVAVDGEGNILVTDQCNHRIQKFIADGQFLAAVGTAGSGPLQFSYPTDIAYNVKNRMVYVVDSGNHRVQILNPDLTFSSTIGKEGSGKGQFDRPWGVACDSTGKAYVADRKNNRIQVFTAEGRFLKMLWRHGQGSGKLYLPNYIAVSSSGYVFVTAWNKCVSVFTPQGQFLRSFGGHGNIPQGIAVNDNGVVCVCCFDDRVIVF